MKRKNERKRKSKGKINRGNKRKLTRGKHKKRGWKKKKTNLNKKKSKIKTSLRANYDRRYRLLCIEPCLFDSLDYAIKRMRSQDVEGERLVKYLSKIGFQGTTSQKLPEDLILGGKDEQKSETKNAMGWIFSSRMFSLEHWPLRIQNIHNVGINRLSFEKSLHSYARQGSLEQKRPNSLHSIDHDWNKFTDDQLGKIHQKYTQSQEPHILIDMINVFLSEKNIDLPKTEDKTSDKFSPDHETLDAVRYIILAKKAKEIFGEILTFFLSIWENFIVKSADLGPSALFSTADAGDWDDLIQLMCSHYGYRHKQILRLKGPQPTSKKGHITYAQWREHGFEQDFFKLIVEFFLFSKS